MTETAVQQEYKVEVYYDRPVFKASYFGTLEEARNTARESLVLNESVCEVRILDHAGKTVETLGRGAE